MHTVERRVLQEVALVHSAGCSTTATQRAQQLQHPRPLPTTTQRRSERVNVDDYTRLGRGLRSIFVGAGVAVAVVADGVGHLLGLRSGSRPCSGRSEPRSSRKPL
jgi:hypothetical protein